MNVGFCGAVNAGIAHATNEIVELLNNDTEVCAGWAEEALKHFADPTIGSVTPLVVSMDDPNIIDCAGQDYHLCGWARNRGYGDPISDEYLTPCDVFGASGSSGFYRRSVLQRIGGLAAEYGAYYDDVDLSFRFRWAGTRCIYEPKSRVLHKGSASYSRQPDKMVYLLSRNEELAFWIHMHGEELALAVLPHLAFVAIRTIRKALSGQLGVFLAGKRNALRRWRWVLQQRHELRRLARESGQTPDLAVSASPSIVQHGVAWMSRRKSA
jgi:GT2 family glycosyltransferase